MWLARKRYIYVVDKLPMHEVELVRVVSADIPARNDV